MTCAARPLPDEPAGPCLAPVSIVKSRTQEEVMGRRILAIAAVVACAGVYGWAAERATFIMADGARKTGTLVAHGGQRNNIIDNQLNLEVTPGHEESYPESNVAVIDFEGGAQPSPNELQALPNDSSSQVLVLRNG